MLWFFCVQSYLIIATIRVTRSFADGTKQQAIIDTERIGRYGDADLNILLMPGDVLDVPESNF